MKNLCENLSLVFIIATKDRPRELQRMFESLSEQTCRPDGVIVVDASGEPVRGVVDGFPELNPIYIRAESPSASGQRNAGLKALDDNVDLVGFMDDDATLEPAAVENMLKFWRGASDDVAGAAFNHLNAGPMRAGILKRSKLCRKLGLYSAEPGRVMPSGWQTLTGTVDHTIYVEWLPSTAAVWRRSVIETHTFEEFFDGYSYLEDLDFSFGIRRSGYRLAVVADAGFYHYPAAGGRRNACAFGRVEVRNRLFFVRKHGLSTYLCFFGMVIRMFMAMSDGVRGDPDQFKRGLGNLAALLQAPFWPDFRLTG